MEKEEKNSGWIVISTAQTAHDSYIPNAKYSHIAAYTLLSTTLAMAVDGTLSTAITLWRIGMRENGTREAEKKKKRRRRQQQQQRSVCEQKTLAGRSRSIAPTIELYQAPHFVLLTGARDGLYERRRRQRHFASCTLYPVYRRCYTTYTCCCVVYSHHQQYSMHFVPMWYRDW